MIAIDTNVVVRFLTRDDPEQASRAKALLLAEPVFLSKTVLLESEWVLRSGYRFARDAIAAAFRDLLSLSGATVEDPSAVLRALAWYDGGLDFADALHLASSGPAVKFATFDEPLVRRAKSLPQAPVVVEP
jgi:predicted nucleic-acid-binding protein